MASPLKQFEIHTIVPLEVGGVDISFTNSSLMMALTVVIGGGVVALAASRGAIVPGRFQSVAEMLYEFVAGLIRETIGAEGDATSRLSLPSSCSSLSATCWE